METVRLAHIPSQFCLCLSLYHKVGNAAHLRQQLLAGNAMFEYAFVDAAMILSRTHLLAAAFRALHDYLHERLKSSNVHSEIVLALSPNNNIVEAFRRFGIADTTTDLLVVKVATDASIEAATVERHLCENVRGTAVAFTDENLRATADLDRIKKAYKVVLPTAAKGGKSSKPSLVPVNGDSPYPGDSAMVHMVETQILGAMALRGAS